MSSIESCITGILTRIRIQFFPEYVLLFIFCSLPKPTSTYFLKDIVTLSKQ